MPNYVEGQIQQLPDGRFVLVVRVTNSASRDVWAPPPLVLDADGWTPARTEAVRVLRVLASIVCVPRHDERADNATWDAAYALAREGDPPLTRVDLGWES